MKHKLDEEGFHYIALLMFIAVAALIGLAGWRVASQNKADQQESLDIVQQSNEEQTSSESSDDPPPLKNIGFNLDYYDPATQTAGDIKFTSNLAKVLTGDPIYKKMVWMDYGIEFGGTQDVSTRKNVQPTVRLPLGTDILAPIDGVVTKVEKLYSNDWTIWFARDASSAWSYETEHVDDPIVKVGDVVKAGQPVAKTSSHDSQHHPGFGIYELGLFRPLNNQPHHWCPFRHLDSSIKDEVNKKLESLYKAWEDYLGDSSIYDETLLMIPGCTTLDPIAG